jgi:aerobic-type carbon monoxide dehydrogenase small subunit (CoxS/CutS family)
MTLIPLELRVNGAVHQIQVTPGAFLLDVLRDDLGLQGTKEACAEGECGACTVLIDGRAVTSCIYFAAQAQGHEITTIEGLSDDGLLQPLQQAFADLGAVQCGFCTPGLVMAATGLLDQSPNPSAAEVREGLAGNLCRCTGYGNIVWAVLDAAMQRGREPL